VAISSQYIPGQNKIKRSLPAVITGAGWTEAFEVAKAGGA
jgi:hypothetical protein